MESIDLYLISFASLALVFITSPYSHSWRLMSFRVAYWFHKTPNRLNCICFASRLQIGSFNTTVFATKLYSVTACLLALLRHIYVIQLNAIFFLNKLSGKGFGTLSNCLQVYRSLIDVTRDKTAGFTVEREILVEKKFSPLLRLVQVSW